MATALPRGIQPVKWKNKDKTTQLRYRVRIQRKDFKADRLFDDLEEATEFLNLSKTVLGREKIFSVSESDKKQQEEENIRKAIFDVFFQDPPVSAYIEKYVETYIDTMPEGTELEKRKKNNYKSFYRTIKSTIVVHRNEYFEEKAALALYLQNNSKVKFGSIPLSKLNGLVINDYVRARLELGKKKSSISREITMMSVCFDKLKFIDGSLRDWKNPAYDFDRSLLANRSKKRKVRLQVTDEEKLFAALDDYPNWEMRAIVTLSLLTSCRRSEIITLTWDQVKGNHIELHNTKNGEYRDVFLTNEAKALIESFPRTNGKRMFSYGISGFEGSFRKLQERLNLKHVRFHDFRRESISRFIEKIGAEHSPILAEMLAFKSTRKFKDEHVPATVQSLDTLEGVRKSAGHRSEDVHRGYFVPKK